MKPPMSPMTVETKELVISSEPPVARAHLSHFALTAIASSLVLPSLSSQVNTTEIGSAWIATERSRNTDVTVANRIFFNMINPLSCFGYVLFSIEEKFRFAGPQRVFGR